MSRLTRWFVLNVAIGVFPLAVKIFLHVVVRGNEWINVLRESSDLVGLGLVLGLTTTLDVTMDPRVDEARRHEYHWILVALVSSVVLSAVAFAMVELTRQFSTASSAYRVMTALRDDLFMPSALWVVATLVLCIVAEQKMSKWAPPARRRKGGP